MTKMQRVLENRGSQCLATFPQPAGLRIVFFATLLALALPLACDDGGGSNLANGGMSGTGISQGPIAGFGSIFVNGAEWEISDADVDLDDDSGAEGDLRVGMMVRVVGEASFDGMSGTATQVSFDDDVEGPITNDPVDTIPGVERRFTVLGTLVVIDVNLTIFDDGATFAGLARDDVVEVSGFVDAGGSIRATRVELKGVFVPGTTHVELKGVVEGLNTATETFMVNGIVIRYDSTATTTEFDDLLPAELANDLLVEVEGVLQVDGSVEADRIEREDNGLGVDDADEVKLLGIVTNFVSLASFEVAGVPVDAVEAELRPADLIVMNGLLVEVRGRLQDGVLIADRLEDEEEEARDNSARIAAATTAVDNIARVVTMLGVTVRADGRTRLEDDRDDLPNFSFNDIEVGDWLEVEGAEDGIGTLLAIRIERKEVDDRVRLRGPVTSFDGGVPSLGILDQAIPLIPQPGGTLYEDQDVPVTEAQFFDVLVLGEIVKVRDDDPVDPAVLGEADKVEIKD